ncbi:MAG TPA: diaminopimelate decarboxylase [Desulfopila sp.]|nr:diaminopimelate decarboxylase [Desulfopila sp.]
MPISATFQRALYPQLDTITSHFGTPFHIYDEAGIRQTCRRLTKAFAGIEEFKEYFAVKALPNPSILQIMQEEGFGFDCSSVTELVMSRQLGARGQDIMYTSNNTSSREFLLAQEQGGCILNLDDIALLDKVPQLPRQICFRYNPGNSRSGNEIIGTPEEAKYGVSRDQIVDAYRRAKKGGVERFGIHTMLASNELNYTYMVQTSHMLLDLAEEIEETLGLRFDFINIGGGLGIPYRPEDAPFDLERMAAEITSQFLAYRQRRGYMPALYMESGRYMTGPHGVLVTRAINRKEIYRTYIGVDACMTALMRPAMYGAYHHIDVLGKESGAPEEVVDVVGSLCENNDKFAIQRQLPVIEDGDLVIIQDTGAHGHAMGFNYNGKLRPQELILLENGSVEMIRRAETEDDYFRTLQFDRNVLEL